MIEVTQKAARMIQDFMENQEGPATVRIFLQTC